MIWRRSKPQPALSLWAAVDARGLQALIEVGWSSWPQLGAEDATIVGFRIRDEAVRIARDELAVTRGEGSLVVFDMPPDVETWQGVEVTEGRLRIPKGRRLAKAIIGDINEEAQYQRGTEHAQVDAVRDAFGELPPWVWRAMVTSPSWLRRGWMTTGAYVDLHPPADAIRITQTWTAEMLYHPGVLLVGSDGGQRRLAIDLRAGDDPPVHLLDDASTGWDDTVIAATSLSGFVERLERGDFDFG